MIKRLLSWILIISLCLTLPGLPVLAADTGDIYSAIMEKKSQYPEGMIWTNDNYYEWHAGVYVGGYGCAGFAFLLSDAAFGSQPGRLYTNVSIADVHVGDVIQLKENSHMVILLEVRSDSVVIAEGNYGGKVHWGRVLPASAVNTANFMITRYPLGTFSETYRISYDANGGSGAPDVQMSELGRAVTLEHTVPFRAGYIFKGWATNPSATNAAYQPGATVQGNQDLRLYAVWQKAAVSSISNSFPQTLTANVNTAEKILYYSFTPDATAIYTFESSGTADPIIQVYDSAGALLFENDDYFGQNFRIRETFSAGTSYLIGVRLYYKNTGSFTFSVKKEVNPYVISNVLPRRFQVKLTAAEQTKDYTFTPAETADYLFESTGTLDGKITIYDMNDVCLASDDNSAGNGNFRLQLCLREGKTYRVHFSSINNTVGTSTVTLSKSSATGNPVGEDADLLKAEPDAENGADLSDTVPEIVPGVEPESTPEPEVTPENPAEPESTPEPERSPQPAVLVKNPVSLTAGLKEQVSFHVEAENVASYQWQYSKDGAKWYSSSAVGCNTDTISITVARSNTENDYRCVLVGEDGKKVKSAAACLVLVTENPQDSPASVGEYAAFSIRAEGVAAYQWQYSKDGKTWYRSGADGAETDSMSFKVTEAAAKNAYRCRLTTDHGLVVCSKTVCLRAGS